MRTAADQFVEITLVSIPADRTESPDVKTARNDFVELRHAHVVLAMPDRDKLVDAAEYLCNIGWTGNPSRLHRMKIYLIISADTLPLETERCWLLGLIVKELVTNAVRHACFFDTEEGKISIELTWEGSFVHCAVSDKGPGMARARPARDFRIAHNLARSLGGRIGHVSSSIRCGACQQSHQDRAAKARNPGHLMRNNKRDIKRQHAPRWTDDEVARLRSLAKRMRIDEE